MKNKSLKIEERNLLILCLRKYKPDLLEKVDQLNSGLINAVIINEMRNAVGDELIAEGFKPNLEPNEYGLRLEDLIDRLADLYLWPDQ